jgi:hypothetical protein
MRLSATAGFSRPNALSRIATDVAVILDSVISHMRQIWLFKNLTCP